MVSEMITFVTLLAEVLMILLCLHTAFGRKIRLDIRTIGVVALDCGLFMLVNMYYIPQTSMFIIYVLLWLYCWREFKLSITRTIVHYIVGFLMAGLLELLMSGVVQLLKNVLSADYAYLIVSIIFTILAASIYGIFHRHMHSIKFSKSFICIIVFYGLLFLALVIDYNRFNSNINIYMLVIFTFLLLGYIYLYVLEQAKNVIEKKTMENELQNIYGKAYEELLNEVRRKQHDFKNQLGAIQSMQLVASSLDELINMQNKYTKELYMNNKFDSILTSCNHPILAGYLYSRCCACEKEGIEIKYYIKIDKAECTWGIHELIEVIGILIDNACENILEHSSEVAMINLSILEDDEQIILSVSNPTKVLSSIDIEKMFINGYSTKGKNRGLGLARVRELANKNDALIEVKNQKINNCNWLEFKIVIRKEAMTVT